MIDPYKVLGVSPSATDDEIKNAYRELAKKYHPDQYADSPLKDLADEKMKQINEAYDMLVSRKKNGAGSAADSNSYNYTTNHGTSSEFRDVRNFIMTNRIAAAEQILNGVPLERRNAEWYFLKGSVLHRRGWVEEAKEHYGRACQMEPGNTEYSAALSQAMNQGNGFYGGYTPRGGQQVGGCNSCDICTGLMCADCCCECMGGDLISCC